MSNQIDITGGARVRGLNGVITGTTGVLNSLPINSPNGIPQLDVNGKILVSQLPNSVMEFLGTWNAATNTPTLADGTGNAGDVYLCNVAGTVNFGSGPITFQDGDYVVYSGTTWERSGGAMGTVTSVAASITGNSVGITGSPITTAGTLAFAFAGTNLQYVNGAGNLTTFPTLITSIGLSMPVAFNVVNSPLTANGTIAVTGAGTASQYIRGDGQLATFPSGGGGGSSVYYYLNGSIPSSVAGYKQMANTAVVGTGTDFNLTGNGLIAQFLTDVGNPNRTLIPSGAWNFEMFFSSSSNGGNEKFYLELVKYNGSTFTTIASTSINPEAITGGTTTDLYITSMAVPETTLLVTDRLAVRVYIVDNSGARTITLHTEDGNLCQVTTTFSAGISSLNGLNANTQYLAVGTAGSDFNINSLVDTHTFNLPTASATKRGALSSADWSLFNTAYNDSIISAAVTGTTTKTLTLNQQDGGTVTASWTDYDTAPVTSVFGRTGAILAVSGDYNTGQVTETGNLYYTNARARAAISLTTTGTSGASSYDTINGILNVPAYTLLGLGGQPLLSGTGFVKSTAGVISYDTSVYVPTSRTITINSVGYDLSADRSWTIDSMVYPSAGIAVSTGTAWGTSLVDNSANWNTAYSLRLTSATAPLSISANVISIAQATTSTSGYLSFTDWNTFNNKMSSSSLTAGKVPFATGSSSLGDTNLNYNGGFFGFGTAASTYRIDVSGDVNVTGNYYVNGVPIGGGGSISLAAIGSTPNANAATLTGSVLNLEPASASFGGVVTTGTQTFAGAKTFGSALTVLNQSSYFGTVKGYVYIFDDQINAYYSTNAEATLVMNYYGYNAGSTQFRNLDIYNGKATKVFNIVGSTGNIGIGNPTGIGSKLQVNGNAAIGYSASTAAPTNGLAVAGSVGMGTNQPSFAAGRSGATIRAASTAGVELILQPSTSTNNTSDGMAFVAVGTACSFFNRMNGQMEFGTNNTERMRIAATGEIGLGTTTIGSQFQVNGNAAIGYSASTAAPTNGLAVSGNVGIGNTTSAWGTAFKALQIGTGGSVYNWTGGNLGNITISSNAYEDASLVLRYINTNGASSYLQNNGEHRWLYAASGTAGASFTFTTGMQLNASGNLGLGTTTIGSKLQVNGNAAIGYSASTAAPTNGLAVSGNTGIGTNTPTDSILGLSGKILDVTGVAGSAYKIHLTTAGYGELSIAKSTNGNYFDSAGATVVANNDIIFRTGATVSSYAVTEVLRITGSGNVGIGTITIGSKLQVNGNAAIGYSASTAAPTNGLAVSGAVTIGNSSSATYGLDVTGATRINVGATNPIIFGKNASYATVPSISMNNTLSDSLMAGFFADGLNFYINSPNRIILRAGGNGLNTNFVIGINSSVGLGYGAYGSDPLSTANSLAVLGLVGIGTNSPSAKLGIIASINQTGISLSSYSLTGANAQSLLDLEGTWNTTGNPTAIKLNITNTASNGSANLMDLQVSTVSKFKVDKTGAVTATSYFEISDKTIKTLIQDNYQTKGIASITPKLYTKDGKTELGYFAQDLVGVLDCAVAKNDNGLLSLSYREVHTAKIYALEQEIKELKAKLN